MGGRRGPGNKNGRSSRAKGGARPTRPGRCARVREREARGSSTPLRVGLGKTPARDREGRVREVGTPTVDGQWLTVEDQDGERWSVECLGESIEVGARIVFEPLGPPDARRGQMVRLLEGARQEWVCTLHRRRARIELVPFGGSSLPDFVLSERDSKGATDGDRVVVAASKESARRPRPDKARRQDGSSRGRLSLRVVEVLGPKGNPDADYRAIVWKHRIARDFPRRARLESEAIAEEIPPAEHERRLDLRHLPFITIDPASARDHDDAVFAEERSGESLAAIDSEGERKASGRGVAWSRRLWVAIADVAHFVAPGGTIDAEARRRGNSFYFPDRAIPMLPERLSTQLCSLVPDVDRLAMVVELRLVADGRVGDALFHEAVIRSHAKLAYEEAAKWLSESDDGSSPLPVWGDSLRCLDRIAEQLSAARHESGALSLELPEIVIRLDDAGRPVDTVVRERNRAHILIEEAMLAANRAVASALDRVGRETIHRVHPPPSPQKLAALARLLERLGLSDKTPLSEPGVLTRVLESVRGTPMEERVNVAVLRSMSQARYEAASRGHFALRFDHYLHFTSPIRRYADLVVHRTLKRWIRKQDSMQEEKPSADPQHLAIWLSGRERVAVEVERDAAALACCSILQGREGEHFSARVTSASEFGLFVRLTSPVADGLVPIRMLDGRWTYDPEEEVLIGPAGSERLGWGDELEVRLFEVDSDRGRLAFTLADSEQGAARRSRRHQSSRSSSRTTRSSARRSHSS